MPINFITGEVEPGPVVVPGDSVEQETPFEGLEFGQARFMDRHALWVDPDSNCLYLDTEYEVDESVDDEWDDLEDVVRVVRIPEGAIADISFWDEAERASYKFTYPTALKLAWLRKLAAPVVGFVTDPLEKMMLNDFLVSRYGEESVLDEL